MNKQPRDIGIIAAELHIAVQRDAANVVAIGALLLEAKEVEHGDWLPWLAANFGGTARTAQNYMNAARFGARYEPGSHLKLRRKALSWLGANMDDCPRTVIDAILKIAETEWVDEECCAAKLNEYEWEETLRRWREEAQAERHGDYAAQMARRREEHLREQAEIDDILDGPPPGLTPPPLVVTDVLLPPFDAAVASLAKLYTKSPAKFVGTTHTPERLQAIAEFLQAVARQLRSTDAHAEEGERRATTACGADRRKMKKFRRLERRSSCGRN
jgi:hypothetical protein